MKAILLAFTLASPFVLSPPVAQAAKAKAAKAAPKGKAQAKASEPPIASAKEIDKFKGDFKWGMGVEGVLTHVKDRIRKSYDERLEKTANDPSRQDRIRKEMRAELEGAKNKVIKFDGQKTGYDTSIIDQEFAHRTAESMVVFKEDNWDRYFFFRDEKLYKMFIAFDKAMFAGKSFEEFGGLMQAKFGKAKEVTIEEKTKAGVKVKLDHYVWGSKTGDALRLVDRSEFYDVFCLVVYEGKIASDLEAARKIANPTYEKRDALVEAVTSGTVNDRDPNDNILDRITGTETKKPGDRGNEGNIVVPSVSGGRGPSAAEVNRRESAEEPAKAKSKDKANSNRPAETRGLEL